MLELIAPKIGGVTLTRRDASSPPTRTSTAVRRCSTTPSAVLPSADGAALLALDAAAKDFVTDAHAHCKFVGHVASAAGLLQAAGVADLIDDGYVALDAGDVAAFITACRLVRFWEREPKVDAV